MMEQHQQDRRASQYIEPLNPHRRPPALTRIASAAYLRRGSSREYTTLGTQAVAGQGLFPFWTERRTQKTKMAKKPVAAETLQPNLEEP